MKKTIFWVIAIVLVLAVVLVVQLSRRGKLKTIGLSTQLDPWAEACKVKEEGRRELTHAPLDLEALDIVAPMGLTAGGHVTPIDHMYFYPISTPGNRFSAKVYAAADGVITTIQHRGETTDAPADARPGTDEYRLTIEQTCNQGYYYDLVTKLSPELKKAAGDTNGSDNKFLKLSIKAGDLIGYVGNQSLDFGVYDTTVSLGFINPESYQAEPWKIHTADAFSYFQKDVLESFLPKVLRTAEPRAGKIDYDKDGYLIGNWFEQGTSGYAGKGGKMGEGYWSGHLALLYDAYDPKLITISMGQFKGNDPQAFSVVGNSPDPGTVNQASGVVKYELTHDVHYLMPNGSPWDQKTPAVGVTAKTGSQVEGIILLQLVADRELKVEVFPGQTKDQVTGFTSQAKMYVR